MGDALWQLIVNLRLSDTALYYTFSTIAQTLAGAVAVLAAFLAFRLPGIEAIFSEARSVFERHQPYIDSDEQMDIATNSGGAAVIERLREIAKEKETFGWVQNENDVKRVADQVRFWWPIRQSALQRLRVSLFVTSFDIAVCLIAIPLAKTLEDSQAWAKSAALLTVVLALVSLVLYYRLIMTIVNPRTLKH
jgi:hypothetical protein